MDKDIQIEAEKKSELSIFGTAAGSSISLLALYCIMPSEADVGKVSATREGIICKATTEIKSSLIPDCARAEQTLLSNGWKTSLINGEKFWHVPHGLSFDKGYWADRVFNPQGRTILAEQELALLNSYSGRFSSGMSGDRVLHELSHLHRIGNATLTFEQISALEKKLADGKLSAGDPLLKPGAFLRFGGQTTHHELLDRTLSVAHRDLVEQEQRFVAARKARRESIGVVLGGAVLNMGINQIAFSGTPMSLRSEVISAANPVLAMTSLRWQTKLAAMVGSVAASRVLDLRD